MRELPLLATPVSIHLLLHSINKCIVMFQWHEAIELAKKHDVKEIDQLLGRYAAHLLEKNKTLSAIELYCKASNYLKVCSSVNR